MKSNPILFNPTVVQTHDHPFNVVMVASHPLAMAILN